MINWKNIRIVNSPLTGQIYIDKVKPTVVAETVQGCITTTDKSGDVTEMAVKAVMYHMLHLCKKDKVEEYDFEIPGVVKLSCIDLKAIEARKKKEGVNSD